MRAGYFCFYFLAVPVALLALQRPVDATEPARGGTPVAAEKAVPAIEGTVPEVIAFVRSYFEKLAQGDLEAVAAKFDESVKLDDGEMHPRVYVRDILTRERNKWVIVTYRPIEFEVTPGNGRIAVGFSVEHVRANERVENRGRTGHLWILRRVEKSFRIVSQHKTVISDTTVPESDHIQRTGVPEREDNADKMGPGIVERPTKKAVPLSKSGPEVNVPVSRAKPSELPIASPSPSERSWFAFLFPGRPSPPNSPPKEAGPEKLASESSTRDSFVVAIDVGHSKKVGGAVSARGVSEYEFNRRLAFALFDHLRTSGFNHSFLINPSGEEIRLPKRSEAANAQQADLFLAIHHDSVKDEFLKNWKIDDTPQSKTGQYCDQFHGYSIFFSRKNVAPERSFKFAKTLGQALLDAGFAPTLHHVAQENRPIIDPQKGVYAFDDLIVLKAAKMPAVLLECGVIVNRREEEELNSGSYRQRMIAAIDLAIQGFARQSSGDSPAN